MISTLISTIVSGAGGLFSGLSWKALGLALTLGAAAALWLWISGLRSELAEATAERARFHREAARQRALLAERDRAIEAFAAAEARAAALRKASNIAREEASHAPETDDGPLAPVLSRALERLR